MAHLLDSHAHLGAPEFDADRGEVWERARTSGVREALVVGYDLPSSARAVELARALPGCRAAVGVHPHEAAAWGEEALGVLERLTQDEAVRAIGEIGLDYYRELAARDAQRRAFVDQLDLAEHLGLPVSIHLRAAEEDLLAILERRRGRVRGVLHCFTGDVALARRILDLGLYVSLAGPVTFARSGALAEVAAFIPEDRLLLETDCPYLAPVPVRGRRNEPAFLRHTAARVAEIRGVDVDRLAAATTANARALFGAWGVGAEATVTR